MTGTSRCGFIISSDAPLDSSKPTHRNTRTPTTPRNPLIDGFRSATPIVPAGWPFDTTNAIARTKKTPTTRILTIVPMLGPHFPYLNDATATPTVSHV